METVMDARCPQHKPFKVVRCTAHQHVGAQCARIIDLDNNALICESCPVFGTRPGMSGNCIIAECIFGFVSFTFA